jgi:pimeloyl-ACP methyl ester carboxylesterase
MRQPAIALLHGGGQGSWVWDALVPLLEQSGVKVVALDVPGCGSKRGRDLAGIDAEAVAAELIADLAAADMAQVTLVGHSLAGAILPLMARIAPAALGKLVYLTCTAPPPGTGFRAMMGSGLQGSNPDEVGWPVDPATTSTDERYRIMFCNDMDSAFATAFLARMGRDDWPMDVLTRTNHEYAHLATIPSTYIVCQQDNGLPPQWQRRFAARLHCERVIELKAGHQAMVTQPAALASLLMAELT